MKPPHFSVALAAAALLLGSCHKAGEALRALKDGKNAKASEVGGKADAALLALVDEQAEGVRFRKDLEFPAQVRVKLTERTTLNDVRMVRQSELGGEVGKMDGTLEMAAHFERGDGRLTFSIDKLGKVTEAKTGEKKPDPKKAEAAPPANPRELSPLVGRTVSLSHSASGWKADKPEDGDFQVMVWGRSLEPIAERVATSYGLLPRPRWFASAKRWKAGDRLELSEEELSLMIDGKPTGKLTLVYEGSEPVMGHPCGRFAISGSVSIKDLPTYEGNASQQELSISAGKVWCSLLHPLVLRYELDTVQTLALGDGKGPTSRLQGAMQVVRTLEWQGGAAERK